MVYDDIVNDEDAAGVRRRDHVLQVGQAAPMRRDAVEVPRRIAVKLAVAIEHNGRNPYRRCAQGLDVIQLLLDAFEIPAVDASAAAGAVIAFGVVVGGVAVEEAVGNDLVDALRLPEGIREGLGARGRREAGNGRKQENRAARGRETSF